MSKVASRRTEGLEGSQQSPWLVVHHRPSFHTFNDFRKVLWLAEVLVNTRKPYVRHMVEPFESGHYRLADPVDPDIVPLRLELALNARDQPVDPLGRDVALAAGQFDRSLQLAPVERLALAVLLDHGEVAQLDALEGRETLPAHAAFAAAADR